MNQYVLRYFLVGLLAPMSAAQAHPFHWPGETLGFGNGLLHSFASADHLLAMLAVGMWLCRAVNTSSVSWLALMFLALFLVGGGLTLIPLEIAHAETLMYAGLLVLGLLLASGCKLRWFNALPLLGSVAVLLGYVHAYDIWLDAGALGYTAGVAVATSVQLAVGVAANLGISALLAKPADRMLTPN